MASDTPHHPQGKRCVLPTMRAGLQCMWIFICLQYWTANISTLPFMCILGLHPRDMAAMLVVNAIHHFHIVHNAPSIPPPPPPPPPRQRLWKIWGGGGKQGAWWSMWKWYIKIISEKLHKNGVSFPEDRNVFVLDHQHGCHDVTCKPEIVGGENIIYILYISRLAKRRLKLGCHKTGQQCVTCLSLYSISLKLVFEAPDEAVRSRSLAKLRRLFALLPVRLWDELVFEILKIPVFVGRVFFILI